jgi:hypothetical protein
MSFWKILFILRQLHLNFLLVTFQESSAIQKVHFVTSHMASELVEEVRRNCTLLCLDVPETTEFGIDYGSWSIGPKFKGVKLIPPGVHYVYYRYANLIITLIR